MTLPSREVTLRLFLRHLPVNGSFFYVFLCICFIFTKQRRSMRLQILSLPAIKIAFFLIMLKQVLLLLGLRLHFSCGIFKIFGQGIMIAAGSGALRSLSHICVMDSLVRAHLSARSQ